jgi:hypothetical protein
MDDLRGGWIAGEIRKSRPLQKERSGFRQKAEPLDFDKFAALCRDAAMARSGCQRMRQPM